MKKYKSLTSFIMLSPILLFFAVFIYYPIIVSFIMSFFEWNIIGPSKFIWFGNYLELFQTALFKKSLFNTLYYTFASVVLSTTISFFLALQLNRIHYFDGLFKTIYFIPVVTSLVSAAIVWKWIYEPRIGILNYVLSIIGISPKAWLLDPNWAMPAVIILNIWKNVGFYTVIFLTGLKAIPSEYYEAALIDGASRWKTTLFITYPLLKPVTFFILTINMLKCLQVFPEVYILTRGGPMDATRVLVFDIWEYSFQQLKFGLGSAVSYVLFGIILIVTLVQRRLLRSDY